MTLDTNANDATVSRNRQNNQVNDGQQNNAAAYHRPNSRPPWTIDRVYQTHTGGAHADKAEQIDRLLIALEESKVAFITYQSSRSTEPLSYPVEPYGLIDHRGSLCLVGHSQQHDEVRHWKLDRIEQVDGTEIRFQRPADFNLQQHLIHSFGVYHGHAQIRVRVRFAPSAARYVREKRMHATQRVTDHAGGGVIAEWIVSSLVEVKSYVLSFMDRMQLANRGFGA